MKKTLEDFKEIIAKERGFVYKNIESVSLKEHFTDLANKMYYEQGEWISVERAKKYARHQHYLGSQGNELVEFEDWECKPPLPPKDRILKEGQSPIKPLSKTTQK